MKNLILSYTIFLSLAFISVFNISCKKDPEPTPAMPGNITLEFEHVVGGSPLVLDAQEYTNANGDQFKVSRFKYYISNIIFKKADGTEYKQPESYYLIDESVPASKLISIKDVPAGEYTQLTFTIGVDSVRNVSGAQTGALDATNGMFWSWKTGYVFVKLEGSSPQSENGGIVFHIGGFNTPHNTIRTISPALDNKKIQVAGGKAPQVHFKVDALKMFQGVNTIKFAEVSTTMGGPNSVKVADNYVTMFTVDHIHN